MNEVITRYAPSPTAEYGHIGGLRTALFNYLFAKKNNGKFILRFEDTDKERVFENFIPNTLNELKQVGIKVDGEYHRQSDKFDHYKKLAYKLLAEGKAYKCFCTKEEMDARPKKNNGYDGNCRDYKWELNRPFVIRLKTPQSGIYSFKDMNYGELFFEAKDLACDPVLLKSDNMTPSYTLASVVDDHESGVTHILRGSEWLSSTMLSVFTYEAFGWEVPTFCHLPVINGSDGKKLSKRHGAASFKTLTDEGYLPEAIINYIAFLGWSPKSDEEIFNLSKLENIFDINNINTSPAVFDYVKLNWFNKQYISNMDNDKYIASVMNFLPDLDTEGRQEHLCNILKTRLTTINEAAILTNFFNQLPDYSGELFFSSKKVKVNKEDVRNILRHALNLQSVMYSHQDAEYRIEKICEATEKSKSVVAFVLRVALSGSVITPGNTTDLMYCMGVDKVRKRINIALAKIEEVL